MSQVTRLVLSRIDSFEYVLVLELSTHIVRNVVVIALEFRGLCTRRRGHHRIWVITTWRRPIVVWAMDRGPRVPSLLGTRRPVTPDSALLELILLSVL